eukprot:1192945-Prorocentrum_minimum.AAC.1
MVSTVFTTSCSMRACSASARPIPSSARTMSNTCVQEYPSCTLKANVFHILFHLMLMHPWQSGPVPRPAGRCAAESQQQQGPCRRVRRALLASSTNTKQLIPKVCPGGSQNKLVLSTAIPNQESLPYLRSISRSQPIDAGMKNAWATRQDISMCFI